MGFQLSTLHLQIRKYNMWPNRLNLLLVYRYTILLVKLTAIAIG